MGKEKQKTREELASEWLKFKREEQAANVKRVAIEKELTALVNPKKGTTYINLPDGSAVKIYVGHETKWDQDTLLTLSENWREISPDVAFPFHQELKADGRVMSLIQEHKPDLWKMFLEPASRNEEKKPSFSAK